MGRKYILPGGTGFLGQELAKELLARGDEVIVLTRGSNRTEGGISYLSWDGETLGDWADVIEGADGVINFTGRSVNCLYTKANRKEILSSRIDSVQVLHQAINQCHQPPEVFIQASSLAIFGDTREVCDENAPHGDNFSVEVCERWEEAFFAEDLPQTRQIALRIGFVLGKDGGALEPLQKLAKYGLGGTIGSGEQYISWLHIEDLNAMILECLANDKEGVYNATGPSPVTNRTFMKTLRDALGKGWSPPAPSPFVRLGAVLFMRADPGLALTGRNCIPKRFLDEGFRFKYTDLDVTLRELTH
ncbi:TIGR01777 family oxidoreductase [Marininema halotolerans]|nr:TIGR01777 family oxidoreductase [Marininema halotolerans]